MINQIIKSQKNNNLEKKICNIQNIIQKTILSAQKYKINDILGANELNMCITSLESIFNDLTLILNDLSEIKNEKDIINKIENVKSELIVIFKNFGTDSLADMIQIIIHDNYIDTYFTNTDLLDKFTIMNQCVHPINFKSMTWKNDIEEIKKKTIHKNRIVEDYMIMDHAENLECFDLARTSKSFQTKVYGIKVSIHDYVNKKTYIIACIVDDILMSCFNSSFLKDRFNSLEMERPNDQDFNIEYWNRFIASLTLKELLVYNNSEIYVKFQGTINQLCLIKQKTVSQVVKEFINSELYGQRTILIQLLIKSNEKEFQYLAYLLYDLLSNENNGNIDTLEQTLLYDSLPWNIKKDFRNAMKHYPYRKWQFP